MSSRSAMLGIILLALMLPGARADDPASEVPPPGNGVPAAVLTDGGGNVLAPVSAITWVAVWPDAKPTVGKPNYLALGLAEMKNQQYLPAIADFDEVLRLDPGSATAYYQRDGEPEALPQRAGSW